MKTELTEISETQKHLVFEVPTETVNTEIARVAQDYSRKARVPGFRQGKVPTTVIKQRYKDQILYDVANDLIPRLVDEALRERGLEPVSTPDIKDVVLEEGQPLKFLAAFETVSAIDPGDYTGISLSKPPAVLEVGAVDALIERLQQRAATWHPVEDRPSAAGDAILMDLSMPGIDGWEAIRRLRAEALAPEVPVAIVSANAFDKALENDVGIAAADFIVKPVRLHELLDWLGARLALSWLEAAAAAPLAPSLYGPPGTGRAAGAGRAAAAGPCARDRRRAPPARGRGAALRGHRRPRPRLVARLQNTRQRIRYDKLEFEFEAGIGLITGQGSDPEIMLDWSDDGGHTWSNTRRLKIGQIGQYGARALAHLLGAARDRIYRVKTSDPSNTL